MLSHSFLSQFFLNHFLGFASSVYVLYTVLLVIFAIPLTFELEGIRNDRVLWNHHFFRSLFVALNSGRKIWLMINLIGSRLRLFIPIELLPRRNWDCLEEFFYRIFPPVFVKNFFRGSHCWSLWPKKKRKKCPGRGGAASQAAVAGDKPSDTRREQFSRNRVDYVYFFHSFSTKCGDLSTRTAGRGAERRHRQMQQLARVEETNLELFFC